MTNALSEAIFEVTDDWYTYWYGEKRDLDYTFEVPSTAATHLANESYPFYHE